MNRVAFAAIVHTVVVGDLQIIPAKVNWDAVQFKSRPNLAYLPKSETPFRRMRMQSMSRQFQVQSVQQGSVAFPIGEIGPPVALWAKRPGDVLTTAARVPRGGTVMVTGGSSG